MMIIGNYRKNYEVSKLVEFTKRLDHYYTYKYRNGKRADYATIFVLDDGSRYRTRLVNENTAPAIFNVKGAMVRFYANPNSIYSRIDGSIVAYGLWINGNEIRSMEKQLKDERIEVLVMSIFIIVLGGIFIYLGVSQIRKIKKEQSILTVKYDKN